MFLRGTLGRQAHTRRMDTNDSGPADALTPAQIALDEAIGIRRRARELVEESRCRATTASRLASELRYQARIAEIRVYEAERTMKVANSA
jgi:hypothetical protein